MSFDVPVKKLRPLPVLLGLALVVGCVKTAPADQTTTPAGGTTPAAESSPPAQPAAAPAQGGAAAAPSADGAAPPAGTAADVNYSPTPEDVQLVEQAIRLVEEVAGVMEQNQKNCDRMGDQMQIVFTRERPLLDRIKAMEKGNNPAREKWFEKQAEQRMMQAVQRMMKPMQDCASNQKVQKAMEAMSS